MGTDKRHHTRILFDTPVDIHSSKGNWQATVIDISLQGALISTPPGFNVDTDDQCSIVIRLDGNVHINMECTIAHIEDDHVGLHCEHIDIDSATHLRRLVELNLGDEELLMRELAALQRH